MGPGDPWSSCPCETLVGCSVSEIMPSNTTSIGRYVNRLPLRRRTLAILDRKGCDDLKKNETIPWSVFKSVFKVLRACATFRYGCDYYSN